MGPEVSNAIREEIYGWYWARNGPCPMLAYGVMMALEGLAERRPCIRCGERLKRGEVMLVAKDFWKEHLEPWGVSERAFRTIIDKLCDNKLTLKRHSKNKKSTIITICKYNDYEPLKRKNDIKNDNKTTTKRRRSDMNATNHIGTRDNINNNEFININKNLTCSGGTPARAGGQVVSDSGEPPVVAEVNALLQDGAYIATLSGRFDRSADWVRLKLQSFRESHKEGGPHAGRPDLERHISSWLQIQVKYEEGRKKTQKETASDVPERDGVVVHPGDIPTREEIEDYHRRAMAAAEALR